MEYNFQVRIESDKPVMKEIMQAKVQGALENMDLSVYMGGAREVPKKVEVIVKK